MQPAEAECNQRRLNAARAASLSRDPRPLPRLDPGLFLTNRLSRSIRR